MLDPISAVGVAAATAQFIDFTAKILVTGKEVHDSTSGTTKELTHLDEVYSDLKRISLKLSNSASSSSSSSSEHQDLCRLATSCHHECENLAAALGKLSKKSSSKNAFRSLQSALAIVWSQKAIKSFETRLKRYQKELTFALIKHMRDEQSSISRGLQSLMADSRGQTKDIANLFEELKAYHKAVLFKSEDSSSRQVPVIIGNISAQIPGAFHIANEMIRYQRLLRSLYFPQIKARHSRIENAHAQTFKWLLKEPREDGHNNDPRQRFIKWLRSGEDNFWISGKAGSGKSTLMKWLSSQQRTQEILFQWANPTLDLETPHDSSSDSRMTYFAPLDGKDEEGEEEIHRRRSDHDLLKELYDGWDNSARVVMASFYFWSAGTGMQKSQQGLFQSLLYEIFSHAPDLMQKACPSRWQATEFGDFQEPWTIDEITEAIQKTVRSTEETTKFCFFVDGVDEYSGDPQAMVRLLQDFSHIPNVKLCLSSRPWNVFEDAFGAISRNKFYLQDLTRGDIKQYVHSKLTRHTAWKSLVHSNVQYDSIVAEIIGKAQGVFLWVFLVVRSLREGLTNGDSVSLLQKRLRRIPTDLREYFKYMLVTLDPIYDSHVAHVILASLDSPEPLPLMTYSFFEDEFEGPHYIHDMNMAALEPYEIIPRHKQTERRLNGRCKGLLEVYRDPDGVDLLRYRVGFLHRTVRDFFMTEEMRLEFISKLPERLPICLSMVKASIAMMKKTPKIGYRLGKHADFLYFLDTAMYNARKTETEIGVPAIRLMDEMAYVLESVNFYEDYWGAGEGNARDMFLGLAIERGLQLYVSDHFKYSASESISMKQLRLNGRDRTLLGCAMGYLQSPSCYEFDVSDTVLFLLTNGCNPNDLTEGISPLAMFLDNCITESSQHQAQYEDSFYKNRIRILKQFLTHGADANHQKDASEWPLWMEVCLKICLASNSERLLPFYIEVLELLLSFGADPNLDCKRNCKCGNDYCTPWKHFLRTLPEVSTQSFARQHFLARVCTMMLENGSDQTIRIHKTRGRSSCQSVSDLIKAAFAPRFTGPILAALPVDCSPMACWCEGENVSRTSPEEKGVTQEATPTTSSTASLWNPLSWWGYLLS